MNDKERVAQHAAQLVKDEMIVGLGTGSTAGYFIEALAKRYTEEGLKIQTVASSLISGIQAQDLGLPLVAMDNIKQIDVYVDGADEVAPDMTLLKGRGADLVREKLLAQASRDFWVLIDQSKRVENIGQNYRIPVEVMPFAWRMVQTSLAKFGGQGQLRKTQSGDGFVITSYGSLVLDVEFEPNLATSAIEDVLNAIPGVVEHGIFEGLATAIFCSFEGLVHEQWL